MKRVIYLSLICLMLSMIVFPLRIKATDATKTPFEYLDQDEQAYVTTARSWITVTKGRIDTARTDLGTFFLQDFDTWRGGFLKEIGDINNGLDELGKMNPPGDYADIGNQCRAITRLSVEGTNMIISGGAYSQDFAIIARLMADYDARLQEKNQQLNKIWADINKQVDKCAKIAQKEEDIASSILESCSYRPVRPY
jgi:hypothetical protein